MDFTVGIISRKLATMSNFVEFRDNWDLHVFRGNESSAGHLAYFEWLTVCHVSGADSVNLSSSVGPMWTHDMMPLEENQMVGGLSG